jgi:hypothetical protein
MNCSECQFEKGHSYECPNYILSRLSVLESHYISLESRIEVLERENQTLKANMCHH